MKKRGANFTILALVAVLFVCSSESQAVYIYSYATGGAQLTNNVEDTALGYNDFSAEATCTTTVSPYRDEGYAKASLTEAGAELKSRSYAPDVYANSTAQIRDSFMLETISGTTGAFLDAVLNFDLTGSMEVTNSQYGSGSLSVDMYARHELEPYLDSKFIRYEVSWDTGSNQQVGFNDNENWDNLFQVNPTVSGNAYDFNIPLVLDLQGLEADKLINIELFLKTVGELATVDFSNTLKTDGDNPFVLTSGPADSSYRLVTDSARLEHGVGLFGSLDGQDLGSPVPLPATVFLLGSGLMGLVGLRKKFKK